jgi:hypothetical protein
MSTELKRRIRRCHRNARYQGFIVTRVAADRFYIGSDDPGDFRLNDLPDETRIFGGSIIVVEAFLALCNTFRHLYRHASADEHRRRALTA